MKIDLSPQARQALTASGPAATGTAPVASPPSLQAMSATFGAPGHPDGTVTTIGEVVVIGQRKTLFTVAISFPEPPIYTPVDAELEPILDDLPSLPPLTPCQEETLKDRAALEAQKILDGLDKNKEWGMYLIRDPDGSIRGVGPIEGANRNGQNQIVWNATGAELGITSWSQLVGLVHTHPMDGQGDSLAYQFSEQDENTTQAYVQAGADPSFRQYLSVGGDLLQFGKNADEGDVSNDEVTGQGCD